MIPVAVPDTFAFPGDFGGTLNGLAIGPGTAYAVNALTGWMDYTASPLGGAQTSGSTLPAPKSNGNGSWPVPYRVPFHEVTLVLQITAAGPIDFASAVAALRAATLPTESTSASLTLQVGGVTATMYGAFSQRLIPTDLEYQAGLTQATIVIEANDIRALGDAVTANTQLPYSSGGLVWPLTWPLTWTGTQVTGQCTLSNPGNAVGPLSLRINGPVTGPVVTHVGSTTSVFGYTGIVAAGDWLDVDMEARTVLYNGQSSRASLVTSRGWFGLEPGDNTIGFNADTYSSSASLTVTASPAWI